MAELTPFFEDVQSHYDLSDDFFALFLDPTRTYSCAYFQRENMTLEEAQIAKVDLSLSKCDLQPGMTLLDVGCGWGGTIRRAMDQYDVNTIGLTLSKNQHDHVNSLLAKEARQRKGEVRLQGWEDFNEKVDRIVSIGAFEHFRYERYDSFFERCYDILPTDGRMMLHTIVSYGRGRPEFGTRLQREDFQFMRFIMAEIFPGGQLPLPEWVVEHAERAGFYIERIHALDLNYARTLDIWAENLAARHEEAVEIASQEVYDRYIKYLTGCAEQFRKRHIGVMQFTLTKHAPQSVHQPRLI